MQARINVQVGKFSKINNCADWNKDVQAGIFLKINKLCSTFIRKIRVGAIQYLRKQTEVGRWSVKCLRL